MSYVALSAAACPEGWTVDPSTGDCKSPVEATTCPAGFSQHGSECWPATETSCRDLFGTFYNPATPDRCKKECPTGTVPNANHVCRPVPTLASTLTSTLTAPTSIAVGLLALGAVVVVALAARS